MGANRNYSVERLTGQFWRPETPPPLEGPPTFIPVGGPSLFFPGPVEITVEETTFEVIPVVDYLTEPQGFFCNGAPVPFRHVVWWFREGKVRVTLEAKARLDSALLEFWEVEKLREVERVRGERV